MPDLSAALGQRHFRAINTVARAVAAWNRIQDRATSITIWRGSPATAISAQTVRIEFDAAGSRRQTADASESSQRAGVIFGVRDHPTTTDTDIQKDDRVSLDDADYRVIGVIEVPGEVQATIERIA